MKKSSSAFQGAKLQSVHTFAPILLLNIFWTGFYSHKFFNETLDNFFRISYTLSTFSWRML